MTRLSTRRRERTVNTRAPWSAAAAPAWHAHGVLLRGGTVIDVDGERVADVRIGRDGRVAANAPALDPEGNEPEFDCRERLVVPGGVDVHTHLHLPVGAVRVSDDFATGTVAAAIGGTTTIIDYVTAYRGESPLDALATWHRWAEPACVDYGLHMTFTERVPERTIAACVEAGVTSFKLYMAYPELLQVDDDVILDIMGWRATDGGLVTLHCENGGAIEALRRQAVAEGRTGVLEHAAHPAGRARRRGGHTRGGAWPSAPVRACTWCTCRPRLRSRRSARRASGAST